MTDADKALGIYRWFYNSIFVVAPSFVMRLYCQKYRFFFFNIFIFCARNKCYA